MEARGRRRAGDQPMCRSLLAATLAASLVMPAAGQPGGLASFRAFLAALWSIVTAEEGCRMDPNGRCAPAPLQTDEGCRMDPDGLCAPAQQLDTDAGCGMDPNGRCST